MYYAFIQLKMPSSHPTLQPKAKNLMQPYLLQQLEARHRQRGVTLIRLLVGITLGLLVVAVGLGALMVSRGLAGSTSEAAQLQQQASYAFRVIGQQIRQRAQWNCASQPIPLQPALQQLTQSLQLALGSNTKILVKFLRQGQSIFY